MRHPVAIRTATPFDRDAILAVVPEAFAHGGRDGHEEVDIVVGTWRLGATLGGLELVAADGDLMIGHVLGAQSSDSAGYALVALLGNPRYYSRFGFETSGPLNVFYPPVGVGDPHFQVRRLSALDRSYSGQFTYCWEANDGVSEEG